MTKRTTQTAMQALLDLGQSVWLDYLRRGMLRSGELQSLIDDGLRGMTSNPTIFEHAIGGSSDYDATLRALAASPKGDLEIFEQLAVEDVRQAADLLRPVYDATAGRDGFVSLEVSPTLARDTEGTIAEGRRLWAEVDRPNVMIKVPGTREGWPAIERLLTEGINVNVTLLFSLEHYRQVAEAYVRALEARHARRAGHRSAGVGRLVLRQPGGHRDRSPHRCQGRSAAGSPGQGRDRQRAAGLRLVPRIIAERSAGNGWPSAGARPQRLLWASTGTKDPTLLRRPLRGHAHRPRHHQHDAARNPPALRGSRDRAPHPAGGRERSRIAHGPAGGRRSGLRRRHPRARGRRHREVRQVVRGAARRDREQAQGARRSGAAQAFRGVRARVDAAVAVSGSTPCDVAAASQAHLGPRSDGVEGRPRHAGDPRSAGLAHGGQGDGPAGEGPRGLRR